MVYLTKIEQNKLEKKQNLYEAAHELFLEVGIEKTTISDIVKKADVAKGTFYLYFKDKDDIVKNLLEIKTCKLLNDAVESVLNKDIEYKNVEFLIGIVDYIVNYLTKNKKIMLFIYKELSYGLLNETIVSANMEDESLMNFICNNLEKYGVHLSNPIISLSMIIDLVGSTCYNSIIFEKPLPIDEFKPYLYKAIKSLIY